MQFKYVLNLFVIISLILSTLIGNLPTVFLSWYTLIYLLGAFGGYLVIKETYEAYNKDS